MRFVKYDIEKYYLVQLGYANRTFVNKVKLWLTDFGLHCVLIYRFGKFAERCKEKNKIIGIIFKIVYYIINYPIQFFRHVDIHLLANIGPGFFIAHGCSIFIGPSKIGANCSVAHNVTIGVGYSGGSIGIPTIGNNVWISTGSIITGNIHVGDGVTIAPGCCLSKSVPDKSLIGGNPGRIISKNYDNTYLGHIHER